jgi:hypothetical protein
MAADVVFTDGKTWFTNSYTWNQILEHAMGGLSESLKDEYEWYVNVIGLDFTLVPDEKIAEIANWLAGVVEDLLRDPAPKWTSDTDRRHMEDLAKRLRGEAQAKSERPLRAVISQGANCTRLYGEGRGESLAIVVR